MPCSVERDAAALDRPSPARRGRGRTRASSVARAPPRARAGCAVRSRRGWPARRASRGRRRAGSRSACARSAASRCAPSPGRCAGACFWKNDLPGHAVGPALDRQRSTLQVRRAASARDGGVVVDHLALGERRPPGYSTLSRFDSFSSRPPASARRRPPARARRIASGPALESRQLGRAPRRPAPLPAASSRTTARPSLSSRSPL